MAKTNRRPSDKFERKQKLAQRPQREVAGFNDQDWLRAIDDEEENDDVAANLRANRHGYRESMG